MGDIESHWQKIYESKDPTEVSWFEAVPRTSLDVIERFVHPNDSIIDIGAGASQLADHLLADGFSDVTVLDVSDAALANTRRRLASATVQPTFVTADVTTWHPARTFELWHDRAVFHFMTTEHMRGGYKAAMADAVRPGGVAVVATFADDGPEQCSGLSIVRHTEATLAAQFSDDFEVVESWRSAHTTPWGAEQRFVWVVLRRRA